MKDTELTLRRMVFSNASTIGKLYIGVSIDQECFTLEPQCRKTNDSKGAIPPGRYQVVIDYSNRFGRKMPHILDVPGFEGIRIHAGNMASDTQGCIILGDSHGVDFVGQSKIACERVEAIIKDKLKDGKVWINILGGNA